MDVERQAVEVLALNDRGDHTVPHGKNYPHQWEWDSAFVAIGLRHLNADRAATEVVSLFRGQWANGMVPNIVMSEGHFLGRAGKALFHATGRPVPTHDYPLHLTRWRNGHNMPKGVNTSGITQPPMIAEAIQLIGEKMAYDERRAFYATVIGPLIRYHEWIYRDRNPAGDDLFAAVHPWETGMDNTPPWTEHMATLDWGLRGKILERSGWLGNLLRRDTKQVAGDERASTEHMMLAMNAQFGLMAHHFDAKALQEHYPLHLQDVHVNSILIRNNDVLQQLAAEAGVPLSDELLAHMAGTRENIEQLWDEEDGLYYSRDAISGRLIKSPTIASLMPLYAGGIRLERAARLVEHLKNPDEFGLPHGVPTVPQNSPDYNELEYWRGATWMNTNWLIASGLGRSGYRAERDALVESSLETLAIGGMHEYFSAKTGKGLGVDKFSWTAALAIDFLESND